MNIEREKEDQRNKARNVVISGLRPSRDISDITLVEQFCETHLTVEPNIICAHHLSKFSSSPNAKHCGHFFQIFKLWANFHHQAVSMIFYIQLHYFVHHHHLTLEHVESSATGT